MVVMCTGSGATYASVPDLDRVTGVLARHGAAGPEQLRARSTGPDGRDLLIPSCVLVDATGRSGDVLGVGASNRNGCLKADVEAALSAL